jgi:phosphatidylglycerophosphate synthase
MHIRQHRSLLADAEKRLLIAMAKRLPSSITSDHLTILGFVAMLAAGGLFARIRDAQWCATAFVAALTINWFGDSLDGTLARVRGQQRPRYGYYVDHMLDLVGVAALLGGFGASGVMHRSLALALAAAYFLVAAETFLATHARGVFRLSFGLFGPTELRLVLAIGAVVVVNKPWVDVFGMQARLFDIGAGIAIAGLAVVFASAAVINTRALYLEEPIPDRSPADGPVAGNAPQSPQERVLIAMERPS